MVFTTSLGAMDFFGLSVFLIRFFTSTKERSLFLNWDWQTITFKAPSNSLILPATESAKYSTISSARKKLLNRALARKLDKRDSWSGVGMSIIIPETQRDLSRSSRLGM